MAGSELPAIDYTLPRPARQLPTISLEADSKQAAPSIAADAGAKHQPADHDRVMSCVSPSASADRAMGSHLEPASQYSPLDRPTNMSSNPTALNRKSDLADGQAETTKVLFQAPSSEARTSLHLSLEQAAPGQKHNQVVSSPSNKDAITPADIDLRLSGLVATRAASQAAAPILPAKQAHASSQSQISERQIQESSLARPNAPMKCGTDEAMNHRQGANLLSNSSQEISLTQAEPKNREQPLPKEHEGERIQQAHHINSLRNGADERAPQQEVTGGLGVSEGYTAKSDDVRPPQNIESGSHAKPLREFFARGEKLPPSHETVLIGLQARPSANDHVIQSDPGRANIARIRQPRHEPDADTPIARPTAQQSRGDKNDLKDREQFIVLDQRIVKSKADVLVDRLVNRMREPEIREIIEQRPHTIFENLKHKEIRQCIVEFLELLQTKRLPSDKTEGMRTLVRIANELGPETMRKVIQRIKETPESQAPKFHDFDSKSKFMIATMIRLIAKELTTEKRAQRTESKVTKAVNAVQSILRALAPKAPPVVRPEAPKVVSIDTKISDRPTSNDVLVIAPRTEGLCSKCGLMNVGTARVCIGCKAKIKPQSKRRGARKPKRNRVVSLDELRRKLLRRRAMP